jgi:conjugal transfer/entry exclusion protein
MTDKEKIKLQEMAEKSGRSVSSYIRAKLFGGEAATINAVEFLEQYKTQIHEMQKIGNNINQLAHYANICKNSNKLSEDVVNEMNDHMADLVRCERELIAVHKRLR